MKFGDAFEVAVPAVGDHRTSFDRFRAQVTSLVPQPLVDIMRRARRNPLGTAVLQMGGGISVGMAFDFNRVISSVHGNPTGYRCMQAIQNNFSRPPWMVLPGDVEWPGPGVESRALKSDPLLRLLNNPVPGGASGMSATMWMRTAAQDLEANGKSFWYKVRAGGGGPGQPSGNGPVVQLRRMPTQRVTVYGNQDDELLGMVYIDRFGRMAPCLPEQVVYLRYPNPERLFDGAPPAAVAGLPAETDTASARFNRELLESDGALPGYVILEGLTREQFAEWKQEWEAGRPGRTRFIRGTNAHYVKAGQTNQELTYSELRHDSQDDMLRAFGVPRAVAFDVSHEALALDTPLPTPDGWTTVGDVQVGDMLLDEAGNPTKVIATTPVYESRDCYEIEFSGGARVVADAGHLWLVRVNSVAQLRTTERLFNSDQWHWVDDTASGAVRSRRVLTVTPVASVPVRCIEVNSSSHLFLCSEAMIPTHNTYANAEREQTLFMQHNILPKWVLICDEMTLQLRDDFPDRRVALNLNGIDELKDSRDAIVERGTKLMSMKALTINEFRRDMGWPPVAWGDEPQAPVQPMSAIPLQPEDDGLPPEPPARERIGPGARARQARANGH